MTAETTTHLHLDRYDVLGDGTIGCLTLHNAEGEVINAWDTLELPWRENRIRESCIPIGTYHVIAKTHGRYYRAAHQRWQHEFALKVVIPGQSQCGARTEILLHWGNVPRHTMGCVLVGERHPNGHACLLPTSRSCFQNLYDAVESHVKTHAHILLHVTNAEEAEEFDRVAEDI